MGEHGEESGVLAWVRRFGPFVVLALVLAACGTRADKAEYFRALRLMQQSGGQNGTTSDGTTNGNQNSGPQVTATRSTGLSSNVSNNSSNQGPTTSNGNSFTTSSAKSLGVSTKVVGDTITVGFHIPLTGAAPLPTSFEDILDFAEQWLNNEGRVNGRGVVLKVEDDGYDPAKGAAACRKLADGDPLFVIGHTMPAVEDQCADYFGQKKIPYLMRGTFEGAVRGKPLSWFGTISDARQGALLAQYVMKKMDGKSHKIAVVYQNDQTEAYAKFAAGVKAAGGSVVMTDQSTPNQGDYGATIQKLHNAGADIVFLSMPPVDAIALSTQTYNSYGDAWHPTWLSGSTYWNYNMAVQAAGMAVDGAIAFSSWPTIDSAAANEFKTMWAKYRPNKKPEDLGLIIWGWTNMIRAAMLDAGQQLSRASFVDALNRLRFSPAYWNPVTYTSSDHLGIDSVAVFKADGQAKKWRQISGFVSSF